MEKKLTKYEKFEMVLELVQDRPELKEFVLHEMELLVKKASRSSETKTQKENATLKDRIVEILNEIAKPVTISEMQDLNQEMASYSNQKISALLKQLVEENRVNKITEKKKSYFSVAE